MNSAHILNMKVTRTKRRSVQSNSDESSNDENTPEECPKKNVRRSKRISSRNKHVFHIPDKKAVMDVIPDVPSTPKSIEKLRPRKLVNDYTRITHRYNYDPVPTDDSDMEDFLDDHISYTSDESSDSGEVEASSEPEENCKLKQRQHTSILESESESESNETQRICHNSIIESDSGNEGTSSLIQSGHSEKSTAQTNSQTDSALNEDNSKQPEVTLENTATNASSNSASQTSDSSDCELIAPRSVKKKGNKCRLKKHALLTDSDNSISPPEYVEQSKRRAVVEQDSDSDQSQRLYSANEDDEKLPSERAQLMAMKREARRRLFEKMQVKRKKLS